MQFSFVKDSPTLVEPAEEKKGAKAPDVDNEEEKQVLLMETEQSDGTRERIIFSVAEAIDVYELEALYIKVP